MDSIPMWWRITCSRSLHLGSSSYRHTWRPWAEVDAQADTLASSGQSPAAEWRASDRSSRRCCRCNHLGSSAPYLGSTQPADTACIFFYISKPWQSLQLLITAHAHTHTHTHTHSAHFFHRAAAPLARGQLTAGGMIGALSRTVALHGGGISLEAAAGWKLGVPRDHHFSFNARLALATLVLSGAAVVPIIAAHGLGRSERGSAAFASLILFFKFSFQIQTL